VVAVVVVVSCCSGAVCGGGLCCSIVTVLFLAIFSCEFVVNLKGKYSTKKGT